MANITIQKKLLLEDALEILDIYNGIRGRLGLYPVQSYSLYRDPAVRRDFYGVNVLKVARVSDPARKDYGLATVTIDPNQEIFAEIKDWLSDGYGVEISDDGEITTTMEMCFRDIFRERDAMEKALLGRAEHGSLTMLSRPAVEVNLLVEDHGRVLVDMGPNDGDIRPNAEVFYTGYSADRTLSAQLYISKTKSGARDYNFSLALRNDGLAPPKPDAFWGWFETVHRRRAWSSLGMDISGTMTSGSVSRFMSVLSLPKDEATRERLISGGANTSTKKVKPGTRLLDIEDTPLVPDVPNTTQPFPLSLKGGTVCGVTMATETYYRTRRVYRVEDANVAPLEFCLSKGHEGYQSRKVDALDPTWSGLEFNNRASHDWCRPYDRLLVLRSPIGWHGVFILTAMMRATDAQMVTGFNRPETPVCYMIPVFMAFKDLKHKPDLRFRRLAEDQRMAVAQAFGLADFLTQALLSLKGAKAKMTQCGLSLDNIPCRPKGRSFTMPPGHMVQTWGTIRDQWTYECTDYARSKGTYSHRAQSVLYKMFKAFEGVGHVEFQDPSRTTTASAAIPIAEDVQRVAVTRRMLEV